MADLRIGNSSLGGFIRDSIKTHTLQIVNLIWGDKSLNIFQRFSVMLGGEPGTYEEFLGGVAVLLIFWLILFWMYRRKIFLRI